MHKKLTILLFLLGTIAYAQHTDRFKKLTAAIQPIDSITIELKYSNDKPKEIGLMNIYEHGDYEYSFYSGKRTCYYRSGIIKSVEEFDAFGNLLHYQLYDFKGYPYCHKQTLKIDTEAKNLDAFFESDKDLKVYQFFKRHRFSLVPGAWFLLEEGETLNGERIGQWKKYNKDGTIKKVTHY